MEEGDKGPISSQLKGVANGQSYEGFIYDWSRPFLTEPS